MIYNVSYDTYRRVKSDEKRSSSGTKNITAAAGFFSPAQAERKAVLGVELGVKVWTLLTEETDFDESDKVIIDSKEYYIEDFEPADMNGVQLTLLVLLLKSNG